MIYRNIFVIIIMHAVLISTAVAVKKKYVRLGIIMILISITGMEILADFKNVFMVTDFYEQYLLLLLSLICLFGMIIIKTDRKE